ncbi:tetratricopeptide repeat protein [Alkalihalobacterium alkalinitrilicum]|uniref:tetratricopeptide repeat protein n=1 Tax=Alkalihalobacterium alkalinitrilicum TaxID=427920 RepID=UPI000994AED2|nr:tetratricopeptide repeat protein [Alkalihalobacterium alkalinitrilicum]
MIYLLDKLVPFGNMLTQTELAEEFKISSSSVSTKYKELENVLWEDIMELQQNLLDFDREDLVDEDEMFEQGGIFEDDFLSSKMSLEREMAKVTQLIQDKDLDSIEEVNAFLTEYLDGGSTRPNSNLSNKDKAQDLIYEAYEAKGMKRKRLAEQTLKLYPNSPDAYNILAMYEDDPEELFFEGMKAGEKELGKAYFNENKGHFWGLVETRPYMRIKLNYACYLLDTGRGEKAIKHFKELLELNPNDNQGVRFELFVTYVEEKMYEEAKGLLEEYKDTLSASATYNRALIEYLQNGPTKRAKQLLNNAKESNPYVIDYLSMKKRLPTAIPNAYSLGDENEAIIYADQHLHLWHEAEEIIEWLTRK